jgi:hypothetical protein
MSDYTHPIVISVEDISPKQLQKLFSSKIPTQDISFSITKAPKGVRSGLLEQLDASFVAGVLAAVIGNHLTTITATAFEELGRFFRTKEPQAEIMLKNGEKVIIKASVTDDKWPGIFQRCLEQGGIESITYS